MEKKPQHSLMKFIMPVPKNITNGAMAMETTPTTVPKIWPTLTTLLLEACLPQMGCQTFSVKIVDAEFSTELNEDRIAPNITAAKKPISGLGSTFITRSGYAWSAAMPTEVSIWPFAASSWNAMMPGRTMTNTSRHLKKPAQIAPFWLSARFLPPSERWMMDWLVAQ